MANDFPDFRRSAPDAYTTVVSTTPNTHTAVTVQWQVPAGELWLPVSAVVRLAASASAGNRQLRFQTSTGAASLGILPGGPNVSANGVQVCTWALGMGVFSSVTDPATGTVYAVAPMLEGLLFPGYYLTISSENGFGSDSLDSYVLQYRRYASA